MNDSNVQTIFNDMTKFTVSNSIKTNRSPLIAEAYSTSDHDYGAPELIELRVSLVSDLVNMVSVLCWVVSLQPKRSIVANLNVSLCT